MNQWLLILFSCVLAREADASIEEETAEGEAGQERNLLSTRTTADGQADSPAGPHYGDGYKIWRRSPHHYHREIGVQLEKTINLYTGAMTDDTTEIARIKRKFDKKISKIHQQNDYSGAYEGKIERGLRMAEEGMDDNTAARKTDMSKFQKMVDRQHDKILAQDVGAPSVPCDVSLVMKGSQRGSLPDPRSAGGLNVKLCELGRKVDQEDEVVEDKQKNMDKAFYKDNVRLDSNMDGIKSNLDTENDRFKKEIIETQKGLNAEEKDGAKTNDQVIKQADKNAKEIEKGSSVMAERVNVATKAFGKLEKSVEEEHQELAVSATEEMQENEKDGESDFTDSVDDMEKKLEGKEKDQDKTIQEYDKSTISAIGDATKSIQDGFGAAASDEKKQVAQTGTLLSGLTGEVKEAKSALAVTKKGVEDASKGFEKVIEKAVDRYAKLADKPVMGGDTPEWEGESDKMIKAMEAKMIPSTQKAVAEFLNLDANSKEELDEQKESAETIQNKNMEDLTGVQGNFDEIVKESVSSQKDRGKLQELFAQYQEKGEAALDNFVEKTKTVDENVEEDAENEMNKEKQRMSELREEIPQQKDMLMDKAGEVGEMADSQLKMIEKHENSGDRRATQMADNLIQKRNMWNSIANGAIRETGNVKKEAHDAEKDLNDYVEEQSDNARPIKNKAEISTKMLDVTAHQMLQHTKHQLSVTQAEVETASVDMNKELRTQLLDQASNTEKAFDNLNQEGKKIRSTVTGGLSSFNEKINNAKGKFPNAAQFLDSLKNELTKKSREDIEWPSHSTQLDALSTDMRSFLSNAMSEEEAQRLQRGGNMLGQLSDMSAKTLKTLGAAAGMSVSKAAAYGRYMSGILGGLTAEQLNLAGEVENMSREEKIAAFRLAEKHGLVNIGMQKLDDLSNEAIEKLLKDCQQKFSELDHVVKAVASGVPEKMGPAIQSVLTGENSKIANALHGAESHFATFKKDVHSAETGVNNEVQGVAANVAQSEASLSNAAEVQANSVAKAQTNVAELRAELSGSGLANEAREAQKSEGVAQEELQRIFKHVSGDLETFRNDEFPAMLEKAVSDNKEAQKEMIEASKALDTQANTASQTFQAALDEKTQSFADSVSQVENQWDAVKRGWSTLSTDMNLKLNASHDGVDDIGEGQADQYAEIRKKREQLVKQTTDSVSEMYKTTFAGLSHAKEEMNGVLEESVSFHDRVKSASKGGALVALRKLRNADHKVIATRKVVDRLTDWAGKYSTNEKAWRQEVTDAFRELNQDFTYDVNELDAAANALKNGVMSDNSAEQKGDEQELTDAMKNQQGLLDKAGHHVTDEVDGLKQTVNEKGASEDANIDSVTKNSNGQLDDAAEGASHVGGKAKTLQEKIAEGLEDSTKAGGMVDDMLDKQEEEIKVKEEANKIALASMSSSLLQKKVLSGDDIHKLIASGYSKHEVHQMVKEKHEALLEKMAAVKGSYLRTHPDVVQ